MIRKIFLFIVSFSFLAYINLSAQDENDSTKENWYDWNDNEWFEWEFHGKPFIEVNYGLGTPKHDKLISKFADVGLGEIKLGYASRDSYWEDDIIEFSEKYLFASRLASDLKSTSTTLGIMNSSLQRVGFAKRKGYGYRINTFRILPYHGEGFVWSRLDMKNYPAQFFYRTNPPMSLSDAIRDTDILNRFQDAVRFGTVVEGGVRFDLASFISLNAGFEAAVIFPRHMFWKQLGSMIIEEGAQGLLSRFIDEIADSSPYAAPIVNFLLKNGFSYAFYSLKKEKMNWPFETEAPLTYETFKIGVTFTF